MRPNLNVKNPCPSCQGWAFFMVSRDPDRDADCTVCDNGERRKEGVMFSSRTPRDLNHDPEPVFLRGDVKHPDLRWSHEDAPWAQQWMEGAQILPRPEFDHVQHNEPNPILVEFRASGKTADEWLLAFDALSAFGGWTLWDHPSNAYHVLTKASAAEADHARRVLALIVHTSKEQS